MITSELLALVEKAKRLEKWPLARLISLFEANTEEAKESRKAVMTYLQEKHGAEVPGLVLGITGTPGAGKSSLIGEICLALLDKHEDMSVAVLAVDPSSQASGGALLGDRTRTHFPTNNKRMFFRSQASDLDLGGVGRKTYQVTRLLRYLFDVIIIETVGIGQSEIEVQTLSDHTVLVLQPLAGDQVQFMKAGVMEVPDTFIINKCDEDALAKKSYHLLKSSLKLVHVYVDSDDAESKKILLTSAVKRRGIDELTGHIVELIKRPENRRNRIENETYYLKKSIAEEYGKYGVAIYDKYESSKLANQKTYEEKEQIIGGIIKAALPSLDFFS